MTITKKFRESIKNDQIKMELAKEIGVSYGSLTRWIYYDNDKFERLSIIAAITKVTGLTQDEIFVSEVAA